MSEWWAAFWFFIPAGVANFVPLFAARAPGLKNWHTPLDFGKTYKDQPIFGINKTWRGLISGAVVAAFIGFLQYRVVTFSAESIWFILLVTGAMGFGALVGDAVESFFKRQAGIKPGEKWFPFDQTDYIIGGLLFAWPFVSLTIADVLRIFVLYFGLHLLFSYIAFRIGWKKSAI